MEVHTYSEEANPNDPPSPITLVPRLVNNEQVSEKLELNQFSNIKTMREQNIDVLLSQFKLNKTGDELNFQRHQITEEEIILEPMVQQALLDKGITVVTGINLHVDDTSMNPQSKVRYLT